MAAERSRRNNAGNRMSKLLAEQEEEDEQVKNENEEFYKTTYGGFNEEEEDNDYVEEEMEDDIVDSDFSLSEKDDDDEDANSEDETKKKKRQKIKVKTVKPKPAGPPKPRKPAVKRIIEPVAPVDKRERMRASTLLKTTNTSASRKQNLKRHPRLPEMRRLTQEELLAEAQVTQEQNLASLAQFLKLEEEKKNNKIMKVRYQGPLIKFQSVRVPLIQDVVEDENTEYCTRNFLEFTDPHNFPKAYFPVSKVKRPEKPICIVTGLPAKYKDPLTGLPYATMEAFKYIRQHRKRIKDEMIRKNIKRRKKKENVASI